MVKNIGLKQRVMINQDIICAVSTPPGSGGIAVIRVSGKGSLELCDQIFTPMKSNEQLATQKGYSLAYGTIRKGEETIDDVIATVFRNPHSYTGEDTVEISCHGSIYIQQQLLQLLVEKGARLATAGEFTQRAFMNGKMDLSQAEAVADLIASTSAGMHRLAINQMRGGVSRELRRLRDQLLHFTSMIELELDFGEEEVEFADRTMLTALAQEIDTVINQLSDSFSLGNAIKNGIPVAIIGETNAGKSTLLNLLVGEERAIVSDIHGTTRDVIEDVIHLDGIMFRFIDTAGIRETADTIENMGIERTFAKLAQASIVLWVIDLTSSVALIEALAKVIEPKLEGKKAILVFNKTDLLSPEELKEKEALLSDVSAERFYISAKQEKNTDLLRKALVQVAALPEVDNQEVIVSNVRHYEALIKAHEAIKRVIEGLEHGISSDFLSQDIRESIHHLSDIIGEVTTDQVLANIFLNFCIGK